MKSRQVNNDAPSVGLKCRRDGQHTWDETGDAGVEVVGEAALYIRFQCIKGCGGVKTRRYTARGKRCAHEESPADKLTYTNPDYLLKRSRDVDIDELKTALEDAVGQAVVALCDPRGVLTTPKPAKKTPAKKTPAKKVTAEKVAEPQPLKRASQRKPVAPVGGRSRAAKQPTTRRTKQSA